MDVPSAEMSMLYRNIAVWGLGVIGFLGAIIAAFFHSRLKHIEANAVTKEYFQEKSKQSDELNSKFNQEILEKLSKIEISSTSINQTLYAQAMELGRHQEKLANLEKREAHLSKWKHEIGDAYLPTAVDNLKERVDKHESRLDRGSQR